MRWAVVFSLLIGCRDHAADKTQARSGQASQIRALGSSFHALDEVSWNGWSGWVAAGNGRTLGVINPATEEVIEEIAYGGRAETRQALEAAQRAMPGWMKLTAWDRAKVLKKTADLMRERLEAIARTN